MIGPKRYTHLESVNQTWLGKDVFVDAIKGLRGDRDGFGVDPKLKDV